MTAPTTARRSRTRGVETDGLRAVGSWAWGSILLVALLAAAARPAAGQWQVREVMDPRSGDTVSAPGGRSDRGFQLDLLRSGAAEGGPREVVAVFRLPPGDPDFLAEGQPPVLRIDDGPSRTALLREAGLTWVAFPVWNGQGIAATGDLRELMQGARLEVTYFLHGGGYKTAVLPLAGARSVLAAAFGIPEEVTPEQRAAALELESAIEAEGARCLELRGKKRERCIEVARACIESSATATELRACIAQGGS
jgi:hypothetical protein